MNPETLAFLAGLVIGMAVTIWFSRLEEKE